MALDYELNSQYQIVGTAIITAENVNDRNRYNMTPLQVATQAGDVSHFRHAVAVGGDLDVKTDSGQGLELFTNIAKQARVLSDRRQDIMDIEDIIVAHRNENWPSLKDRPAQAKLRTLKPAM